MVKGTRWFHSSAAKGGSRGQHWGDQNMFSLRRVETCGLGHVRRMFAPVLFALLALTLTGLAGVTPVRADELPFWERADAAKSVTKTSTKTALKKKKSTSVASAKSKSGSGKKLGGYAEATEPVKKKKKGVKVAALGNSYYGEPAPKKSLSGGGVRWVASSGCLDGSLKSVIYQVAANYGPVTVSSTCRSKGHNRAVGGARKSKHLSGDAADFRVSGNVSSVYSYLRNNGSVGGLKHYGGGLFHIDNGDRRSW
jgi:Peptidase M15